MTVHKEKILKEVQRALNTSNESEVRMSKILELLAKNLGGSWAAHWIVDKDKGDSLRLDQVWHAPDLHSEDLDSDVSNRKLSPGEGMPGKVWRTMKAESSKDITKVMMLPLSLKALSVGFDAGMWIPIVHKKNVHGVIEILGCQAEMLNGGIVKYLQSIGEEIGKHLE